MKIYQLILVIIFFIFFSFCCLFAKESENNAVADPDKPMILSLSEAIDVALKKNPDMRFMQAEYVLKEKEARLKKIALYVPSIKFSSTASVSKGLYAAKRYNGSGSSKEPERSHSREASVEIKLSDINLFNMGQTEIQRESIDLLAKTRKIAHETKIRKFIFGVIRQYFTVVIELQKIETIKADLLIQKTMVELTKQRVQIKQAREMDVIYLERNILRSKEALSRRNVSIQQHRLTFNRLLCLPLDQKVVLTSKLHFVPSTLSYADVKKTFDTIPAIKQSTLDLEIQKLNFKQSWLSRIPALSIDIGGYKVGYNSSSSYYGKVDKFEGGSSHNNLDLRASIGFSIPIFGKDGLFNSLSFKKQKLALMRSEQGLKDTKLDFDLTLSSAFHSLKGMEEQVGLSMERLNKSSVLLDDVLAKYRTKKATTTELKEALDEVENAYQSYHSIMLSHFFLKMSIADMLGLNHLLEKSLHTMKSNLKREQIK